MNFFDYIDNFFCKGENLISLVTAALLFLIGYVRLQDRVKNIETKQTETYNFFIDELKELKKDIKTILQKI
jgi:hypothetical protein